MLGVCRGCNQEKDLIEAHIIPESFFREIDTPGESSILVEGKKESYIKRRPKGVYDKNILCMSCEKRFQKCDEYAQLLLLKSHPKRKYCLDQNGGYFFYESYDYKLLKRFVISLLWRASISKDSLFSQINLGPFENRAKELLWSDNVGSFDEFAFFFAFTTNLTKRSIIQPIQSRFENINVYRFYLGEVILYIKVDKRNFDPKLLLARDNKPLYFITSNEIQNNILIEALSIVKRANKSKNR
jgi:hypothetical protein